MCAAAARAASRADYFTCDREPGSRNDFLGRRYEGEPLDSCGINPGGYIGFFDPKTRKHETYSLEGDSVAKRRMPIKGKAQRTRRSLRYRAGYTRVPASVRRCARSSGSARARSAPVLEWTEASVGRRSRHLSTAAPPQIASGAVRSHGAPRTAPRTPHPARERHLNAAHLLPAAGEPVDEIADRADDDDHGDHGKGHGNGEAPHQKASPRNGSIRP
jgi:hypothetical protein